MRIYFGLGWFLGIGMPRCDFGLYYSGLDVGIWREDLLAEQWMISAGNQVSKVSNGGG